MDEWTIEFMEWMRYVGGQLAVHKYIPFTVKHSIHKYYENLKPDEWKMQTWNLNVLESLPHITEMPMRNEWFSILHNRIQMKKIHENFYFFGIITILFFIKCFVFTSFDRPTLGFRVESWIWRRITLVNGKLDREPNISFNVHAIRNNME